MTASGQRAATQPMPRAMAGAVSRLAGSAMMFPAGRNGTASRVGVSWASFVRINVFSSGTTPSSLSTVFSSRVLSSNSRRRCFGLLRRLIGQNLSPLPPAMMNAKTLRSLIGGDDGATAPMHQGWGEIFSRASSCTVSLRRGMAAAIATASSTLPFAARMEAKTACS